MRYVLFAILPLLVGCSMGYPTAEDRQAYLETHNPPAHIAQAIEEGRPAVGMNVDQLIAAIGKPTQMNATHSRHASRYQLIYDPWFGRANGRLFVYVEGNKVVAVQY